MALTNSTAGLTKNAAMQQKNGVRKNNGAETTGYKPGETCDSVLQHLTDLDKSRPGTISLLIRCCIGDQRLLAVDRISQGISK